jgi:hypothetical protein
MSLLVRESTTVHPGGLTGAKEIDIAWMDKAIATLKTNQYSGQLRSADERIDEQIESFI